MLNESSKKRDFRWALGLACLFTLLAAIVNFNIYLIYGEVISLIGALLYATSIPIQIFILIKNHKNLNNR